MMLGLSLIDFTRLHTIISLIAIATGLLWLGGYLRVAWLPRTNLVFLVLTILTTLTGFLFPLAGITPAVAVGIVSTALHALAPTQGEPPFAIAQGVVLIGFVVAGWRAFRQPAS